MQAVIFGRASGVAYDDHAVSRLQSIVRNTLPAQVTA